MEHKEQESKSEKVVLKTS